MKIDSFFKRAAAQPDVQALKGKLDISCNQKGPEPGYPGTDTHRKVDVSSCSAAKRPRVENMDIDGEQRHNSGGTNATNPLSEATNRQLAQHIAPDVLPAKPAAQMSAIDLCDSPPAVAQKPAQPQQHVSERAASPLPGESAADKQQEVHDGMDVDPPSSPQRDQAKDAEVPAPTPLGQQQTGQIAQGEEPLTPCVMLQPAGSGNPPGSAAVNTSTAKVPQDTFLTPDQRKRLLEECLKEQPLLEVELDNRPDLTVGLPSDIATGSSKKGSQLDLKHQISILVEGQSLPLTQLAQHISTLLSSSNTSTAAADHAANAEAGTGSSQAAAGPVDTAAVAGGGNDAVSALVVRNIIQDVASRKSYGLQDGALAPVDAFEDMTAAYHWCWELRSLTGLPKAIKQQADAARKHRKQVLDRLKACSAFIQLAQGFTKSTKTAESKIAKAAAKLSRLSSLQELQAVANAAAEAVQLARQHSAAAAKDKAVKDEQAAQAAAAKAEKARVAEADKASKEAERAAKEAEKAAKAAARAAEAEEKARQKAEEDKKREEARQQKAAEEARKREEKAKLKEEKQAAKKGFHSAQEMQKSKNLFMNFLKKEPRPVTPPAGPSADHSQGQSGSQQQQQQETAGTGAAGAAAGGQRTWAPACAEPSEQQVLMMQQLDQELPGHSAATAQPAAQLLAALVQHWKLLRPHHKRTWGLPPSWARRPGAATDPDHIAATAEALYGEGVELSTLRCWRRKLIKHNDSVRPPYYGSWSRISRSVSGRKPFGQDVELDYEVMSDQDWEEEPEGESLSDDADDDDEPVADDATEDEEGFVVGDGYLSEDEGLRDEDGDTVMAVTTGAVEAEKDPIELAQERAKARGRFVVLAVNDIVPNLSWEPTTNLEPSLLLSSLQPTIFTPEITPLQPWEHLAVQVHGRPASAAAAATPAGALARTSSADAGCVTPTAAATAGDAAAVPTTAGASGAGRKQSVFPEDALGALVQHIQANSTLGIDKLVDQFVDSLHGACFTGKLTKKCVRDKIREIATMRKGRVPGYAVKPEFLAVLGGAAGAGPKATNVPTGVWGVRYKDDTLPEAPVNPLAASAEAEAPVDAEPVQADLTAQAQQQQQLEHEQTALEQLTVSPAAATTAVVGVKRPASADPVSAAATPEAAADGAGSSAAQHQQQQAQPTTATASPPAKKQKTPASGIERFFKKPKQPQQQQAAAPAAAASVQQVQQQAPINRQQQQLEQEYTPPSTPKRSDAEAAPADAEMAAAADGPAAAEDQHTGVLPMLTPPSADAADRPSLPHSPVPFRLNSAGEGANPSTVAVAPADQQQDAQEQQQQQRRPPINRWHAQADCRGMSLQGGSTSSMPPQQEQQEPSQPFGGFNHQQQQQQNPPVGFVRASDLPSGSAIAGIAAASGSQGLKPKLQAPELAADGSPPDSRFWRQLATWIVCVREPSQSDIDAAFDVFSDGHLQQYVHSMPQSVVSAMVKTLGSYSQTLPMRAACARCISNIAQCLATKKQPQTTANTSTPQKGGPASPAAAAAVGSTPSASPKSAAGGLVKEGSTPASSPPLKRRFSASPSPSSSPRSAPVAVSFEELCAEPLLLTNLQLAAITPSNQLDRIKQKVGEDFAATVEEAMELSRCALRATAALAVVGLPHPLSGSKDFCPAAAAAAAQIRLHIASSKDWRGTLNAAVNDSKAASPDKNRCTYALMIQQSLLSDPEAASQLVSKPRLAKLLAQRVMQRASRSSEWVIQKWSLLVMSALLSDEMFEGWVLPTDGLCQFHAEKSIDEAIVDGLGKLLITCLQRQDAQLSQPGPDRIILGKSLTLTRLLVSVLGNQLRIPGNNGRLPGSIADFVGSGFAGSDLESEGALVSALKEVGMQDDWEEAAVRARQILEDLGSAMVSQEVEMKEMDLDVVVELI